MSSISVVDSFTLSISVSLTVLLLELLWRIDKLLETWDRLYRDVIGPRPFGDDRVERGVWSGDAGMVNACVCDGMRRIPDAGEMPIERALGTSNGDRRCGSSATVDSSKDALDSTLSSDGDAYSCMHSSTSNCVGVVDWKVSNDPRSLDINVRSEGNARDIEALLPPRALSVVIDAGNSNPLFAILLLLLLLLLSRLGLNKTSRGLGGSASGYDDGRLLLLDADDVDNNIAEAFR